MREAKPATHSARLPIQGPGMADAHQPGGINDGVLLRLLPQPDGQAIDVTGLDVIVGRHSQADIRLPLPDVSRQHCRLVQHDGQWHIFDLNSLNGIFVNGRQVRQATLRHGDTLRIGGFTFLIDLISGHSTTELPVQVIPYPSAPTQERRQAS